MNTILKSSFFLIISTAMAAVLAEDFSSSADQERKEQPSVNKSAIQDDQSLSGDETIRNFFPLKGRQKWLRKEFPFMREMLFFNVSIIRDDEEVTLASLHLHRRRLIKIHDDYHKKFLPSPYRVVLYQVQPNHRYAVQEDAKTMKLASLPVSHRTKGGWHTLDVTPVIRELLINAQGPIELLFGVQFEAPKKPEDTSRSPVVPIKHFLKSPNSEDVEHPAKSSCYLVVRSERDPFFEDFDEEEYLTTSRLVPTSSPGDRFKERHFRRKSFKGQKEKLDSNKKKEGEAVEKEPWKSMNTMENEVYKRKSPNKTSHKAKNKKTKAEELALEEKTKLKWFPFLHVNEVEEIRRTLRRLTRSSNKENDGNNTE